MAQHLLLPIIIVLFLSACTDTVSEQSEPSSDIQLHKVQGFRLELSEQYQIPRRILGKVSAVQAGDVGFELAGKVSKVYLDEGDRFEEGDLLAELDTQLLGIEQRQLRAQMSEVQAQLKLSRANQDRLRSLKQSGYTSTQSIDEITTELSAFEARLTRLEAELEFNRIQQQKSRLLAPFAGKVERRMITPGVVLSPGQSAMRLVANHNSQAKFGVPSEMVKRFSPDHPYQIEIGGTPYPAHLLATGAQVNPDSRTVQLRFKIDSEMPVLDGQLAYLLTRKTYPQPGYWIPLTALTDGLRGRWNIYVLAPDPNSDDEYRLERRDVTILYANQTQAYIEGAVSPEESIVATGLHRVVPGQRVLLSDLPVAMEPQP